MQALREQATGESSSNLLTNAQVLQLLQGFLEQEVKQNRATTTDIAIINKSQLQRDKWLEAAIFARDAQPAASSFGGAEKKSAATDLEPANERYIEQKYSQSEAREMGYECGVDGIVLPISFVNSERSSAKYSDAKHQMLQAKLALKYASANVDVPIDAETQMVSIEGMPQLLASYDNGAIGITGTMLNRTQL